MVRAWCGILPEWVQDFISSVPLVWLSRWEGDGDLQGMLSLEPWGGLSLGCLETPAPLEGSVPCGEGQGSHARPEIQRWPMNKQL